MGKHKLELDADHRLEWGSKSQTVTFVSKHHKRKTRLGELVQTAIRPDEHRWVAYPHLSISCDMFGASPPYFNTVNEGMKWLNDVYWYTLECQRNMPRPKS